MVVGDTTYLQPYGMFFLDSVPAGKAPPTKPYLFSSGAHPVAALSAVATNSVLVKTVKDSTVCQLIVISNGEPTVLGDVTIPSGTRVAVNASDFTNDPTNAHINKNSVILIDQDPTQPLGPYIFTDHEIPVDVIMPMEEPPKS